MTEHSPADIDEALLLELTGQTEVSDPDHARALIGVAQREERMAREAHEATPWPLRRAKLRMLPVKLRMPPLVAALVLCSAIIFTIAMLLILVRLAGTMQLFALISLGYTLGFGVILYLLIDSPGEHDDNREVVRRRALQAAVDARVASAAKVMRLEQETRAREELLERVIEYGFERDRRRRQEQIRQQRERAKLPATSSAPPSSAPPSPPPPSQPREPEYGGG
jgi:hypothetical protein